MQEFLHKRKDSEESWYFKKTRTMDERLEVDFQRVRR